MGKIILGSSSPRRADILKKLDIEFKIIPSSYVEPHDVADFSYEYVEDLAYNKALDVAKNINDNSIILGADTIVVLNNQILEKPKDRQDAISTLKNLSGKTHFVVTSVALVRGVTFEKLVKSTTTYVMFNTLTDEQIINYVDNYKPFDKAGSYGIQELPDGFVKSVEGSLDNVIGLPSETVVDMLNAFE